MGDRTAKHSETSRRQFVKAGTALALAAPASGLLPGPAAAQNAVPPADAELAALQQQRRILLKGGVVLTLDRQIGDFARADVLIENGRIAAVRPDIAVPDTAAAIVDARNRIVLPGFIDTHHHFFQGLFRSVVPNSVLVPDYNHVINEVLTPSYRPADVHAGVLITALTMIDNGTTAAVDTSQITHTPEHSDACIAALQESGIRAVHAHSRGAPGSKYPDDVTRLQRTYFNSDDQLLTLALGSVADPKIFAVARQAGVRVVAHGPNGPAGQTLIEMGRAGLLRAGDEFIHCAHIDDEAWKLLKESGARVSIAVPIEMAMGQGIPPIQEALDHGIRPSLSSDVDSVMAMDPFTLMRAAFTLQRMQVHFRAYKREQNVPPLLTCREVLEFATVEGARTMNLDRKVGTLTPGKEADIVMLRTDRLNVWPLNNAAGAVVNLMNPANVDTVFIAGKVRKWRGNLVGVDVARVMRMVEEARDGVLRRSGFQPDLLG